MFWCGCLKKRKAYESYKNLPNKACTGRWGFCGIFWHFSGFEFSCSRTESTPAPAPVTQTVSPFLAKKKDKDL
jgi:hypothetical protein